MSFLSRVLRLGTILSLLITFGSAQTIALADFQPAAVNLSPACNLTYITTIPNCNSIDFSSGICSGPCIASLVQTSYRVYLECSTVATDNQLLIARFLAGQGISTLCPNVVVETVSGSAGTTTSTTSMATSASMQLIFDTRSSPVVSHSTTSTTSQMLNWSPSSQISGSSSSDEITTTQVVQITSTRTLLSTIALASSSSIPSTTNTPVFSLTTLTTTSSSTYPITTTFSLVASSTPTVSPTSESTALVIIVASSSTQPALSPSSTTDSLTIIVTAGSAAAATTYVNAGPSSNCGRYGGSPFDYCNSGNSLLSTENVTLSMALACIIGILVWM